MQLAKYFLNPGSHLKHFYVPVFYFTLNTYSSIWITTLPATRSRSDVVKTSLCTSQRCRRYVSNETPNDVSVERRQDVSVVRLHNILLERRDNVSRRRNNDVPWVRLHTSQTSLKWNTQWCLSGASPRRLSGKCPRRPISTSLRRSL